MHKKSFHSILRKVEAGDVTVAELTTLFHPLLRHGLSADRQLIVCRTLAQLQHYYATEADPRLEGWITDVVKALEAAGAEPRTVQAIGDKLASGTYLRDEQYARVPEHEATSLTVDLHLIFFGQRPKARVTADDRSPLLRVIITLRANINLIAGGGITAALVLAMFWLYSRAAEPNQSLCPPNSVLVHGDRPIFFHDGSEAILEPGAEVCYNGSREVGLIQGTVGFEIEPDAAHPFSIRTPGGVQCLIYGTGLTVSHNIELQTSDVAVKHGIVVVKFHDKTLEILPGQKVSIDLLTKRTSFTNFDPTTSDIKLERVTLKTLARELEEHMHVTVRFEGFDPSNEPISVQYKNGNLRLRHIVGHLNLALSHSGIEVTLSGTTITFRKKR